ncbi:MAG TPA: family 20 glycosylhydrolase, partial [Bacteroidota bacterium]
MGDGCGPEDRFAADQVNEHLLSLGLPALTISHESRIRSRGASTLLIGPPKASLASAVIREHKLELNEAMKQEGYVLAAGTNGISIIAESARGRFYGVMTLLQLMKVEKRTVGVPRVLIRDWPLQGMRGITDDLSRGQVSTMENFKKIIRFLARYKLNVYSPYIEDIFVFKNHPLIGKNRGALTDAQIRELDSYAKRFHVELIPIFETLGHWENILLLPEYARYAEFPGAHTLNVSDESSYELLDEMIGELAAAFSSPWFNMAADESWDVGLGASRKRVEESDLATVHAEHYKRLFDILKKHGKQPLMYGDIILNHPAILEKIPKDVVIVDWQYWAGQEYPSAKTFRDAGFPFVVSPAVWNFTGPFPNYVNTILNVRNFARSGYENGAMGILTSNWNDYGGEALRELNYYGFAWTAECAWQPLEADPVRFDRKFFVQMFGNDEAGHFAREAYLILGNPYALVEWHDFWRHPLLPERSSPLRPLWRFQTIESTMPVAKELADKAEALATSNKDHFRYLRFAANLNLWYVTKMKSRHSILEFQQDSLL